MGTYYPEGGRVDVVVSFPDDGAETQWYEPFERAALGDHCTDLEELGVPYAVVGFDFTPFAQDYGWAYDADGCPLDEKEEDLRAEIGESAGHLVDDAIESRWDDLLADAGNLMKAGE